MMTLAYLPIGQAADAREEPESGALPTLELLEFLGEFETDSGDWVSPGELMTPEFEQLLKQLEGAPGQASGSDDDDITISDDTPRSVSGSKDEV